MESANTSVHETTHLQSEVKKVAYSTKAAGAIKQSKHIRLLQTCTAIGCFVSVIVFGSYLTYAPSASFMIFVSLTTWLTSGYLAIWLYLPHDRTGEKELDDDSMIAYRIMTLFYDALWFVMWVVAASYLTAYVVGLEDAKVCWSEISTAVASVTNLGGACASFTSTVAFGKMSLPSTLCHNDSHNV